MDFNPDMLQKLLIQDLDIPLAGLANIRAEALKKSLLKKYVPSGSLKSLQKAAFSKFLAVNERVGNHEFSEEFLSSDVFLYWKGLLYKALYSGPLGLPCVTLASCLSGGKQGPGVTHGNDDTLFFTKMFNSDITVTDDFLYKYYEASLPPRWLLAESERKQHWSEKVVFGSILSTVRKNRDEDRTTCKEPTLNMFYQLGAKSQFEAALERSLKIDIPTQQPINRALAQIGSLRGEFATLDLRSASDSISVKLCELLLPPEIFRVLMQIRSSKCRVGNKYVHLNMISTMGNGFTFALMTLIFGTLVKAVYLANNCDAHFANPRGRRVVYTHLHRKVVKTENMDRIMHGVNAAVFGDDIIVLSQFADQVKDVLGLAGFEVNIEKSFTEGPFRESCGGDFYLGSDVRGVYLKKFSNETHVYSIFNRLMSWSGRFGIPLPRTLRFLLGSAEFRTIPVDHGIDGGFITPLDYAQFSKSKETHAYKFSMLVPVPEAITRCGERFSYHHAGLVTHLGGYVTDDTMYVRSSNEDPMYIVKTILSPFWNGKGFAGLTDRELWLGWAELTSA